MDKPKKKVGRPFKKGQSGNPLGGPKLSPEYKAFRALDKIEVARASSQLMRIEDLNEMRAVVQGRHEQYKEFYYRIIASALIKSWEDGSFDGLDRVLNRTIGKVADQVHHMGKVAFAEIVTSAVEKKDDSKDEQSSPEREANTLEE